MGNSNPTTCGRSWSSASCGLTHRWERDSISLIEPESKGVSGTLSSNIGSCKNLSTGSLNSEFKRGIAILLILDSDHTLNVCMSSGLLRRDELEKDWIQQCQDTRSRSGPLSWTGPHHMRKVETRPIQPIQLTYPNRKNCPFLILGFEFTALVIELRPFQAHCSGSDDADSGRPARRYGDMPQPLADSRARTRPARPVRRAPAGAYEQRAKLAPAARLCAHSKKQGARVDGPIGTGERKKGGGGSTGYALWDVVMRGVLMGDALGDAMGLEGRHDGCDEAKRRGVMRDVIKT